jgi:hypothetical protein
VKAETTMEKTKIMTERTREAKVITREHLF